MRPAVVGPNEPEAYPQAFWRGRHNRPGGSSNNPACFALSRRSRIFAWARSRATMIVPVSETGRHRMLRHSARIWHRPAKVDPDDGREKRPRRSPAELRWVSFELFEKMPSRVILPWACRSAEQDTPRPIGSEAPWRGRRMTRTSWQKYLPPNCAPTPIGCVSGGFPFPCRDRGRHGRFRNLPSAVRRDSGSRRA